MSRRPSGDGGQASLMMLAVVAVLLAGALVVFAFGNALGARGRHQRAVKPSVRRLAVAARTAHPPHRVADVDPTEEPVPCDDRTVPRADIRAELKALTDEFFRSVSFESGGKPAYARIRDLFIEDGKLIRNSSELPEISSVDDFIASRQSMVASGALTSFEEFETAETTEVFGNVAHRFSTYKKRGTLHGEAIEGGGLISTQFIRTPSGWKVSSMAWDDERPGLAIPDRYR